MKRKLSIVNYTINATDIGRVKRENFENSPKTPSLYIADNASVLDEVTALIIKSILNNIIDSDSLMEVDKVYSKNYMFLFFLDAQGKEQMSHIRDMLHLFSYITAIFVSLRISGSKEEKFPSIAYLNTKECKSLSRQLRLLDPLGGGEYPINHLIIIDLQMRVRYRVPLKFSHCYSAYQKFGLQLAQLHGLIEEYSSYAATQG